MDRADRELRRLGNGSRFLYLRYCDDMVILSPSRGACRQAFDAYRRCMWQLRLPVHPASWPDRSVTGLVRELWRRSLRVEWGKLPLRGALRKWRKEMLRPGLGGRYGKAFWKGKTRAPYRWAPPLMWFRRSPWIQFVGYQFRSDGVVRIRKDSFVRHVKKVSQLIRELLHRVDCSKPGTVRKTQWQIMHRLRMRLVAMAVGRRGIRPPAHTPQPASWCGGFEAIDGQPFVERQLAALDRHRERQLNWFRRAMAKRRPFLPGQREDKPVDCLDYYGHPFSYRGQFKRGGRKEPTHSAAHPPG